MLPHSYFYPDQRIMSCKFKKIKIKKLNYYLKVLIRKATDCSTERLLKGAEFG